MASEELHINTPEVTAMIKACAAQDPLGQRRLFEFYYGYVKSICLRYTSKLEDCEEVMDDSFIKVFRNLDKYDFARPFKYWLRTVVVNTAIDFYRQNNRIIQAQSIEDYEEISMEDHHVERLSVEEILAVVQKLSPAYRTVFMMFVVDGYTHKEISEMLKITEGTSKSNLAKARIKLQDLLIREYPQEIRMSFVNLTLPSNI
ncbi:MAG TPA: sigma-70 family RNA polymerase sigma factor [Saprospiraceae bacterium]|nr:sigma-70 family RNA polymerase sigma factor [Saprospiraceae bacterium]